MKIILTALALLISTPAYARQCEVLIPNESLICPDKIRPIFGVMPFRAQEIVEVKDGAWLLSAYDFQATNESFGMVMGNLVRRFGPPVKDGDTMVFRGGDELITVKLLKNENTFTVTVRLV